jgi:ankyrin repeat protein
MELGADIHAKGLFGATALHWTAMLGLPKLASALLAAGARTDLPDVKYKSTPLEWAQYAWLKGTNGHREGIPEVARLLGGSVVSQHKP